MASRINASGLDLTSQTMAQPPRQTPLHARSPQYKPSILPSREIAKSESLSPRTTVLPVPGHSTDKQSCHVIPRNSGATQTISSFPAQYAPPSRGSSGHSTIPGDHKQTRVQVRPQTEPASSRRSVNPTGCTQPLLYRKVSPQDHPKTQPTRLQTVESAQSTWRTYYVPSRASSALRSDSDYHIQPSHNKIQPSRSVIEICSPSKDGTCGVVHDCGNNGHVPKSFLTEHAGQLMRGAWLATSLSVWQIPSAIVSWAGSTFRNTFVGCFRRSWSAQESLGLHGFSVSF